MSNKDIIRGFIIDELMMGDSSCITDHISLKSTGMIDSTSIMELITFIEHTFCITIDDDDITPKNFDNIEAISMLVDQQIHKSNESIHNI